MDNQASTKEETYTEEGATTPPGNTIPHNQATHSPFPYSGMMVPYVEGPKMDWTVDDALHSRFIRWNLPKEEITLQTIWSEYEDFCKPQSNAVCARFDLLTTF